MMLNRFLLPVQVILPYRLIATLMGFGVLLSMLAAILPASAQLPQIGLLKADLVVVFKDERLLHLKRNGQVLRSFKIALGGQPEGHKRQEGDGRTPEGVYKLDWRNPNSQFYRSIHVSYPKKDDQHPAERWNVSPGGMIMIHGMPNGRDADAVGHPETDWTNGCIAIENVEMDEIWSRVDDGTTIIIYP